MTGVPVRPPVRPAVPRTGTNRQVLSDLYVRPLKGDVQTGDRQLPTCLLQSVQVRPANRYEICARLGILFEVTELEFDSRDSAADWIDANQLGRRNLTPEKMSLLRGRRYNRTKRTQSEAGSLKGSFHQNEGSSQTAELLAEQHGVSKATIEPDGKFAEAVEVLGMADEVSTGELSAPKAAIVEASKALVEAKKAHDKWQEEVKKTPLAPPPVDPVFRFLLKNSPNLLRLTGQLGTIPENKTIDSHFCVSLRRAEGVVWIAEHATRSPKTKD